MWTKRYLINPTKDEYFKGRHPIAVCSILLPMILYYLLYEIVGITSWWMVIGFIGSLVFGEGLMVLIACVMKVYKKLIWPISLLIVGSATIVLSLILSL